MSFPVFMILIALIMAILLLFAFLIANQKGLIEKNL